MTNPLPLTTFNGNEIFLIRQFVTARVRNVELQEEEMNMTTGTANYTADHRHYAMVSLMYVAQELEEGKLLVKVNLPELNKEITENVSVTNLITLADLPSIVD